APIYQTSTYVQQGLGKHKGYEYARTSNPTREALERNIAALEGGRHGFAFASGLAAVDAVLKLLSQGDHVVSGENVYGGTHRQMTHIWARHGLEFSFVDAADAANVAAAVTPRTRMVYAETPTNPMMRLCDLQAVAAIARGAGALCVVDNPFAPPRFQRPPHRRLADPASQGQPGLLPRSPLPPATRSRLPPDERVRRHDLDRAGIRGACATPGRAHQDLRPGRVAGRRREPDRTPGVDD